MRVLPAVLLSSLRRLAIASLDLLAGVQHICCNIDGKLAGEPAAKTNLHACVFRRVWQSLWVTVGLGGEEWEEE